MKEHMKISTNLRESMFDQAEKYVEVATHHKNAYMKFCDWKLQKTLVEAQIDDKIRKMYNIGLVDGAPDKTKTKLTEAQITAKIHADKEYVNTVNALNEAECNYIFACNMLEAMKQRKEMLMLLSQEKAQIHSFVTGNASV